MNSNKKNIFKIIFIVSIIILILSGLVFYIINNQRQRAVKEMANKILSSAEYHIIGQIMDGNPQDIMVNFPDDKILDLKGNLPTNGYIKITADSKIEVLYYYNGYCVSKTFNEIDASFKKTNKNKCLNN